MGADLVKSRIVYDLFVNQLYVQVSSSHKTTYYDMAYTVLKQCQIPTLLNYHTRCAIKWTIKPRGKQTVQK